jgi:hypothetical protein
MSKDDLQFQQLCKLKYSEQAIVSEVKKQSARTGFDWDVADVICVQWFTNGAVRGEM